MQCIMHIMKLCMYFNQMTTFSPIFFIPPQTAQNMIWNKCSSEWDELSGMGMVELESTAAATTSTPFKAEDHKLSPPRPLPLSTEHTNINQAQTLGNLTWVHLLQIG